MENNPLVHQEGAVNEFNKNGVLASKLTDENVMSASEQKSVKDEGPIEYILGSGNFDMESYLDELWSRNYSLDSGCVVGGSDCVDEITNDFARSAFGGSDYDDNLDMDQQSQEYWNNL